MNTSANNIIKDNLGHIWLTMVSPDQVNKWLSLLARKHPELTFYAAAI